jgi:hypothetical protein
MKSLRQVILPLGLLILIGACILILLGAYFTHRLYFWSIYTPIYDRLLHSIASAPGLLSETDKTDLNPEASFGFRRYEVDQDHLGLVSFFEKELLNAGWDVVEDRGRIWELRPGEYLQFKDMLLVTRQPYWFKEYWLIVEVDTYLDVEGTRTGNSRVDLTVYKDEQEARWKYGLWGD